ncbi:MAG: helix-turn-helix domain-containing protein [Gaiellaceae bacterium]
MKQVAMAIGATESTVNKWASGDRSPSCDSALAVGDLFGVDSGPLARAPFEQPVKYFPDGHRGPVEARSCADRGYRQPETAEAVSKIRAFCGTVVEPECGVASQRRRDEVLPDSTKSPRARAPRTRARRHRTLSASRRDPRAAQERMVWRTIEEGGSDEAQAPEVWRAQQ